MNSFPSNSSNSPMDNFLIESLMGKLEIRNPVNNLLVSQSSNDYLYREEVITEEEKLEREIINIIVNGKGDSLKPNSGQFVSVLGHSICVDCKKGDHGDCMVWEWHGHIQTYIEEREGYCCSLEQIYGAYTQRSPPRTQEEKEKRDCTRILLRHLNAASPPRY